MHAHVHVESADCDGRYTREYTRIAENGQSDADFQAETFAAFFMYANQYTKVEFTSYGFVHSEPDEEGYVLSEITWCEDDDESRPNVFRDHSAEAAGY